MTGCGPSQKLPIGFGISKWVHVALCHFKESKSGNGLLLPNVVISNYLCSSTVFMVYTFLMVGPNLERKMLMQWILFFKWIRSDRYFR